MSELHSSSVMEASGAAYWWRWLTNPRTREVRRMTRRGYRLEWGSDGRIFWN